MKSNNKPESQNSYVQNS